MGAFFQIEDLLFQNEDLFFKSKTFFNLGDEGCPYVQVRDHLERANLCHFLTFWIRFRGTSRGPTDSPFAQPTLAGL